MKAKTRNSTIISPPKFQERLEMYEDDDGNDECEHEGQALVFADYESKDYFMLYGMINEASVANLIYSLTLMTKDDEKILAKQKEEKIEEGLKPITIMLNSEGGYVSDFFALYDVIKRIQKTREVHTIGIGKIMSACVPLLACGTKGKRKIGNNTRVMLHSVGGGNSGSIHSIKAQFEELKLMQKKYALLLEEETKMPKKIINKIFDKKVDVFLDAKQAIEYGIADELM